MTSDGTIWKANVDGTGRVQIFDQTDQSDSCCTDRPAWSPDHVEIAFQMSPTTVLCNPDECIDTFRSQIFTVSASPPSPGQPRGEGTFGVAPNWSPDGARLAFHTEQGMAGFPTEGGGHIGVMNRDGSGRHLMTPENTGSEPAWSPDGTRIVFSGVRVINSDGSGNTFLAPGRDPDWQPLPSNTPSTYVRPKGATPVYVPLVPAFTACSSPNRTHGPPLEHPSCHPPVPASPNLVVSVGETRLQSRGSLAARVLVGAPGGVDDTDVRLRFSLTNVIVASTRADYTELRPRILVRRTDKEGAVGSTTIDFPLSWVVPCAPTDEPQLGASCALDTTLDTLVPGAAPERTRAIWALDALEVDDGGPDGDADTESDNSLFATQGVFVP
jgi:hypothetical protein